MDPQILWLAWCFETCFFLLAENNCCLSFSRRSTETCWSNWKLGNLLECFITNYLGGGFKYLHFLPRMLGENDPIWQTFFWKWVVQPPTIVIPLFLNKKCTLSFFLYFTGCTLVKKCTALTPVNRDPWVYGTHDLIQVLLPFFFLSFWHPSNSNHMGGLYIICVVGRQTACFQHLQSGAN